MTKSAAGPALRYALQYAETYLNSLDVAPVAAIASAEVLRQRLPCELQHEPLDPLRVVEELVAAVEGGLMGSAGGRFFGWVIGGTTPAALAADWLTSVWDQNPGIYAVAPAAAVVEETCGQWLLEVLKLPRASSFALVTGCQMAHVTCFAAARNAVLARRGWDVEQRGLFGAPPLRVVTSSRRHGTIERALRMLGLGRDCVVDIPLRGGEVLSASALEAVLAAEPSQPTVVLLQAGDVNTGSFDSFEALIPLAHKYDAWVHVDGAFGLWVAASSQHRHRVRGVAEADSWATDGHKWLNVPYDCGYAFVKDRQSHLSAMSHDANYLQKSDAARDAVDWTPEHSRRARGFATYAALRSLGRHGIERLVDDCCRYARSLVEEAAKLPNVQVVHYPEINQGLLRFLDPRPGATAADHDRRTESVMARVAASGQALFTGSQWDGQRCMRVSVSSWQTTDQDVQTAVRAIQAALHAE